MTYNKKSFVYVRGLVSRIGSADYLVTKYLINHYHDVSLIGVFTENRLMAGRIHLIRIPFKPLKLPFIREMITSLWSFFELFKLRPMVVLWHWGSFFPGAILFKLFNKSSKLFIDIRSHPIIIKKSLFGSLLEVKFRFIISLAEKIVDGYSVLTMSMLLYIQKRYGRLLNRKQICIWSSGYDEELFKRVKDYLSANLNILSKLRNILGIRATKVLLYYGSLDKSRLESLILMVETIKLLLNDGFDIQLIILGDGNGINFLKNIIKHNQLESYVIIKPTVPYVLVPVILYVADLVFAPFPLNQNWYVQFPLKIAEAIGMGKPVITTPLIELKCLLPSDFIVEAFDPVALKERVIKILFYSNLDEYSSKIKELQNNLSWATVAKKLSRLIDS